MFRQRALQVVLGIVGLLFMVSLYPVVAMQIGASEQMLGVVYATLGLFLLLAVRDPAAHRSLIAFTAWSSLTHSGLMAWQASRHAIPHEDLLQAVLPLSLVGIVLIVLTPRKS